MPWALAARPRKMLPPPMTMAVSTPSPWSSPTSAAIRVATAGIDAELLLAHQGFARQLEEDAFVEGWRTIRRRQASKERLYRSPPGLPTARWSTDSARIARSTSPASGAGAGDDAHVRLRDDGASRPTRVLEGSALFAAVLGAWPRVPASRRSRRSRRPTTSRPTRTDAGPEEEAAPRQGRPRVPRVRHVRRQHVQAGEHLDLRAVRLQLRGIAER